MKLFRGMTILALILGFTAIVASSSAGETEVALEDVPGVVKDAALEAVPGIRLVAAEVEREHGHVVYELEGVLDGKRYEVEVTDDGKVVEVESEGDDEDHDEDEDEDEDEGHDHDV